MLKRFVIVGLFLAVAVSFVAAQDSEQKFVVSGDLTTIYTVGNADYEQRVDVDQSIAGAFFNVPGTGTRKNGYYTAVNLFTSFKPLSWLEGQFKIYWVHRPGSFYLPLQMENLSRHTLGENAVILDGAYGKVSVFEALGFNLPVELTFKAGKFKSEASQFGVISKYRIERVLYMMNTKTDFTYEFGFGITAENLPKISFVAATNYLFDQSVQRYYDEDGAVMHGVQVLNEYAPQFLFALRLQDLAGVNAELLYGQNVSGIYSGHAAGASVRYAINIGDSFSIPLGLSFAFHEKNIDILAQAAIAEPLAWAGQNITTMSFRNSIGAALGAGLRYKHEIVNLDFNLAGAFYNIKHYYRTDLNVLKLSADVMATFVGNYFIGGGVIFGNLLKSVWETRKGVIQESYHHEFGVLDNMGYEVYAGINLGNSSRFVIGFNQNKGISLNNMLEARHEGQLKYKQKDTNWSEDELAEAGGLYIKFFFRF